MSEDGRRGRRPGPAPVPQGPPRTVVIGHVTTDVIVIPARPVVDGDDNEAAVRITPGGQAANTAAWLAWQGTPVTLVTSVGDDADGRARIAELTEAGVDCAARRHPGVPTGSVVVVSFGGRRTMMSQRGANVLLAPEDIDVALIELPDAGHVHLSAYVLLDPVSRAAGLRALAAAREHGLTVSVDAASAELLRRTGTRRCLEWLRGIDLLIANEDEARALTGHDRPGPAAGALTATARQVAVKLGARGALWADRDGALFTVAARPVDAVDTTGAGDAFAAGLLTALTSGADARTALRLAGELGAAAVRVTGARPGPRAPGGAVPATSQQRRQT
ncbi:carbohydrate kinase family protein [Streptomyces yaizuensis]|uniref:Sugar kinase n=1 Tax=Streptomyces yaizuensis TaxID=2989713 RepID=A0ABQ5NRA1_9ACTN|nr:PfkB family carbohydrate kinase [Streptomyces sp. YSPA8]GLF92906.1 sugar kinase [Streptomyces sp. YSPA8]